MTTLFWTPDRLDDAWWALAAGEKTEHVAAAHGVTLVALTNALHSRGCGISTARAHWRKIRNQRVWQMHRDGMTYDQIGRELGCGIAQAWRMADAHRRAR